MLPWTLLVLAAAVDAQDAQALRARHAALRAELADNAFGRPLHVESSENGGEHKGAIYAVIGQPFSRLATALRRPVQWCACEACMRRTAQRKRDVRGSVAR